MEVARPLKASWMLILTRTRLSNFRWSNSSIPSGKSTNVRRNHLQSDNDVQTVVHTRPAKRWCGDTSVGRTVRPWIQPFSSVSSLPSESVPPVPTITRTSLSQSANAICMKRSINVQPILLLSVFELIPTVINIEYPRCSWFIKKLKVTVPARFRTTAKKAVELGSLISCTHPTILNVKQSEFTV